MSMAPEAGQLEPKPFQRRTLPEDHPLLRPHVQGGSGIYVRDRLFPNSKESVGTRIITTPEGTFIRRHDNEKLYDSLAPGELELYREEMDDQLEGLGLLAGG